MTPHRPRRATLAPRPPPTAAAAPPPPPAAAPTVDPVSEWVLEYLLRQPNIDDSLTKQAFSLLSLSPPFSPRLTKIIHLRDIASELSRRSLSEGTLRSLESIEELDRIFGAHPPTDSMKTDYRLEAAESVSGVEAGALVSGVAEDARNALKRALVSPRGKGGLLEWDMAFYAVQRYWKETLEGIGPPLIYKAAGVLEGTGPPFLEEEAARVLGVLPSGGSQERNADERCAIELDGGETTTDGSPVRSIDKNIDQGEHARAKDATDQKGYSVCGVSEGTAALKAWFADLLMMVQDPLPDAVSAATEVASTLSGGNRPDKLNGVTAVQVSSVVGDDPNGDTTAEVASRLGGQNKPVEPTGNQLQVDTHKEVTSTSTSTSTRDVTPGGDPTHQEGSSTAAEHSIRPRTSLMDQNPPACTLQWGDDSIESPSESSSNPLKRIRLLSPTRRFVSPLQVAEDITSRKHRKIKRRSVLEEDTLRKAVERAIMAKAKGKEKLASSNVPDEIEATGDDVTAETIASEPVNLEAEDLEEAEKAELESSEEEEGVKVEENNSDEVKKDEANKDGPIDAEMTLIVPENGTALEGDTKEVVLGDKGVENISNKKRKRARRKKAASNDAGAAPHEDAGKTDSSAAEKDKFSGLIFMCNSKTKEDCYKYKILGLPESKKDTVAKIHKGMRLFLYDLDLKLMYGIYKAASNGGYDIEPKAFKSAFPSQVRFTVLNDCKPLPEAKFRAAIKSNYFWGNKFHPQLSLEQVKNLCTLFTSESNTLKQKRRVPREPTSARCDQEKMKIHRFHHVPHHAVPGLFVRDAYVPPTPRQLVMAPPPAAYVYDRPVDDYYYRRDPPLEHRESRLVEIRPHEPMAYERDPYSSYSQPAAYREPLYPASLSAYAYAPPASAYAHPSTSAYGPPPNYPY